MVPEKITPHDAFSDARLVARYADGPPRIVPGFADMQRMSTLLLAERVPDGGRVLVVGAGGGLELKTFAQAYPTWTFDGVDPSSKMIELAVQTLGTLASRVQLHEGTIDAAPAGPFDAATCLLTMHFLSLPERLRTAVEVRRRLKPGSPFVVVHMSIPAEQDERTSWMSRYAAFAISSGIDAHDAQKSSQAIKAHLNFLSPQQDESILREAGFSRISLFYVGFTFRGWVAYA
ncbi:class I SAM-dependent methyltransferase [Schlesneria sp. DSM 10557]|uniref:class I SAM-dependent methyltransferase n=1 Tax=Schlesneria sp. DSM 10557 TaxID=3044399 RepID=UPI0035A1A5F8